MGLTKTSLFTKSQNQIADILKAMGHPARVAIIEHLLKVNSCIGTELGEEIPLSQPTISQHLRELKKIGIIQGEVEGNKICYYLNPEVLGKITDLLSIWNNKAIKNINCC